MLTCSLGMHVSTNVQLYRGGLVYLKPPSWLKSLTFLLYRMHLATDVIRTHNSVVIKTDYILRGKSNYRTITVTVVPNILIGNRALQDEIINIHTVKELFPPATDDICYCLLHWDADEVRFALDQHAELDLHSASSLKPQSANRHVVALGYIVLIPSQTVFTVR
jgi:hypothetical protein